MFPEHSTSGTAEVTLDFIERLFGISPDGGDGSTELMYFAAFVAIVAALGWRWYVRRSARSDASKR
jgi:hypothetical protein